MKKKSSIALLTTLLILAGCSNEGTLEETKIVKVAEDNKETKKPQVKDEPIPTPKKKEKAVEKEEIIQKKTISEKSQNIVPKSESEKEETKPVVEATPAPTKKPEPKKEKAKPKDKPIVKTEPAANEKVNAPAPPITKTSLSTIDLLLPPKNSEDRTLPITNVVLHFTSNAAQKPKEPYNVQDIHKTFVDYGVSAHYMIGREGEIYLLVPENRIAFHAGKGRLKNFPQYNDQLNKHSIGIEMMAIGTKSEMTSMISATTYDAIPQTHIGYTEAQYQSLHRLINDITQRNPTIKKDRTHIVGHDEYAPNRKTDPGTLFNWSKIGF